MSLGNNDSQSDKILTPIDTLTTADPFLSLFPINSDLLDSLTQSMKDRGFDPTQAIHIWKEKNLVIDGHTRLMAAREACINEIPVYPHSFQSEDQALQYAWSLQLDRRNLSDRDIFLFVRNVDLKQLPGKGKSKEKLARLLHISATRAQNILTVIKKADQGTQKSIAAGKTTINKAYQSVRQGHNAAEEPRARAIHESPPGSERPTGPQPPTPLKGEHEEEWAITSDIHPNVHSVNEIPLKAGHPSQAKTISEHPIYDPNREISPWNRPRDDIQCPSLEGKNLMQTYMTLQECQEKSSFHRGMMEGFELALKLMEQEAPRP